MKQEVKLIYDLILCEFDKLYEKKKSDPSKGSEIQCTINDNQLEYHILNTSVRGKICSHVTTYKEDVIIYHKICDYIPVLKHYEIFIKKIDYNFKKINKIELVYADEYKFFCHFLSCENPNDVYSIEQIELKLKELSEQYKAIEQFDKISYLTNKLNKCKKLNINNE
jgi:hypothetical protein